MKEPRTSDARPYHHGDLRRALVDAARRLLESEGPAALSLRAVAREAGVSPAAPYHHFKDKSQLLEAIADEGWARLGDSIQAGQESATEADPLTPAVLAYVLFARAHPALYRVMYDSAREKKSLPTAADGMAAQTYFLVRDALARQGADPTGADVELVMAAGWCAAHGLAEMADFPQFELLKARVGGEVAFLNAVLHHMGMYRGG